MYTHTHIQYSTALPPLCTLCTNEVKQQSMSMYRVKTMSGSLLQGSPLCYVAANLMLSTQITETICKATLK